MAPPAISPTESWIGILLFVLFALVAVIPFAARAGELIALLVKARHENRTDHIGDRIGQFFLVVLGQSGALRDSLPGIAHFFTEVLAAACPFCITMFDDGIKGVEAEEKMQIEDIAEIVAQTIEVQKTHT